jgi:hypothetical protein
MFEAYKVGVTLALQNQVSSILGLISRDFIRVDRDAKALQGTLKEIKLLGMSGVLLGGAGFMGLHAISGAIKPATEYVHQLQLAKAAGMQQLEIAEATRAAWEATSSVMTTTATGNLAAIRELRMVFGDTRDAINNMPVVQKLQAVLQNVRGGNGHDEAYTVAKALEMKGAVKDPSQFENAADLMTRAMIASGGKVSAQDFLSAFKYGRAATIGWNDRFAYSILPTLIQEMKSSGGSGGAGGPGNALMSAYAAVIGGAVPQKSLKVWQQLGMLDPSKIVWDKVGSAKGVGPGGILGGETFQHDPYQWTQQYLVPALIKAGYDTEDKQRQALQYLFPNRTAGFIMSQMALQGWKFDRDQNLIRQASGLSAYDLLIKKDPNMAYAALSAQWENLKTALGVTLVPVLIPFLRNLTGALNAMGRFAEQHPTLTKALMLTFTGLSLLATIGGGLMVAGAGFKLIGVALGTISGLPLAGAAAGLGTIATALGSIAGLGIAVANADKIGAWKYNPINMIEQFGEKVGSRILSDNPGRYGYAPPPSNNAATIHTTVNIDGRKVASAVNAANFRDAARSQSGGNWPDGRALPAIAGAPGG